MRHVRPVSLRFLSSRLQPERRRLSCSRSCRPPRFFSIRPPLRAFSLPRRKQVLALGYSPDVEFNPIEETEFSPAYTESLSFALVNAFPDMNLAEQEALKPLPTNIENIADDPSLENPLERMERMGTGWFGVILDLEGVVVQSALDAHMAAWIRLAEEENRPRPLQSALKRAAPMKAEQVHSFLTPSSPPTITTARVL